MIHTFSERDRALIESLVYEPAAKPSFELIKSCLIWPDEAPRNLTSEGYERLGDLWVARSFVHRGLPFSSWKLNPNYYGPLWDRALQEGIRWPGFQRLKLSELDQRYLEEQLRAAATGGAD